MPRKQIEESEFAILINILATATLVPRAIKALQHDLQMACKICCLSSLKGQRLQSQYSALKN